MKLIKVLLMASTILSLSQSWAFKVSEQMDLSRMTLSGKACASSMAMILDGEENKAEFMLASNAAIEVKKKSLDRSTCIFAIPVDVPQGFKLRINQFSVEALMNLPKKAKLSINSEAFFAGSRGIMLKNAFLGAQISKEQLISHEGVLLESGCGQDVILRNNTSLLTDNQAKKVSTVALDNIVLSLELVACESGERI